MNLLQHFWRLHRYHHGLGVCFAFPIAQPPDSALFYRAFSGAQTQQLGNGLPQCGLMAQHQHGTFCGWPLHQFEQLGNTAVWANLWSYLEFSTQRNRSLFATADALPGQCPRNRDRDGL